MLMKFLENRILRPIIQNRIQPGECYPFWEHYCKGFRAPCRDLFPEDVTVGNKKQLQYALSMIETDKRNRLLIKITGWPRFGFLGTVFEDAKFIHIMRDGRAVANSLINVGFWQGWRGPENWRWGILPSTYKDEWDRHNQSFIVLAAIQWKILMGAVDVAKNYIKEQNLLEITYEQLCSDPIEVFRRVAEFAEIRPVETFEGEVKKFRLNNTNSKWERELNDCQKKELYEVLREYLEKYGYL